MGVAWSQEGNSSAHVSELVVSEEHQGRSEVRLLSVFNIARSVGLEGSESGADVVNELVCVDVAGSRNDDVAADVELLVESAHLVCCDILDVLSDARHRLSHKVVSETGEVHVLKNHPFWVQSARSLLVERVLLGLHLLLVEQAVADSVVQ